MTSSTPLADKLARLAQKLFEIEADNEKADEEYEAVEDAVNELEVSIEQFDEALEAAEDDEEEDEE